jgi:hypothetical protein
VVRRDQGFVVCIPIYTYEGRGLGKFRDRPTIEAHAQVHMTDTDPEWLHGEPQSSKRPIAVIKASPGQKLNTSSRVCFSRPRTLEMTEKVADVGVVTRESLAYLLGYYNEANKAGN